MSKLNLSNRMDRDKTFPPIKEKLKFELLQSIRTQNLQKFKATVQNIHSIDPSSQINETIDPQDDYPVLHQAIIAGFEQAVKYLCEMTTELDIDFNRLSKHEGLHPLYLAVMSKSRPILDLLVSEPSIQVNSQTAISKETALYCAVRNGEFYAVNCLLQSGAAPNIGDKEGNTALHLAVRLSRIEMIKKLMDYGADSKLRNKAGKSVYSIAIKEVDNPKITEILNVKKAVAPPKLDNIRSRTQYQTNRLRNPGKEQSSIAETTSTHRPVENTENERFKNQVQEIESPRQADRLHHRGRMPRIKENLVSNIQDPAGQEQYIVFNIENERSRKISEKRRQSIQDPDNYYLMNGSPVRGICLIFNNEKFFHKDFTDRPGTDIDENSLKRIFEHFGYIVKIYKNMSGSDIYWNLANIAQNTNHSKYDSFVCCILSHGCLGKIYGIDGNEFAIKDLSISLTANRCPTLAGKPKMFFIQACRGDEYLRGYEDADDHDATNGNQKEFHIPDYADFLYSYATVGGFKAQRHQHRGSIYVQKLCHYLEDRARISDVLSILTKVNADVSAETFNNRDGLSFKQMPEVRHTLTKKIRFA